MRLERFFFSGYTKALKFANKNRVVDVLERLERSENLRQLARPKDRLHRLKGVHEEFYSIRISKNYRIIFRWVEEEGAHDVDLLDYHWESWLMRMFNPPHPGRQVREDIEILGWTVTEAAGYLGCSRKQLSDIVNLKAGISPEMAIRLSAIIGGSPGLWCRMQLDYDLWQVEGRTDTILGTVKQPPKEKYMIHD